MNEQEIQPIDAERAEIVEQLQADPRRGQMSFPEWFLAVDSELELAEQRIKEQAAKMIAFVQARRKALHWKCGQDFREAVDKDIVAQSSKKRSKDYLTGRAGYRTAPAKVLVLDSKKLIDWCALNLPEAVPMEPRLHLTPLKAYIESTGETPPGCDFRKPELRFYPSMAQGQIAEDE